MQRQGYASFIARLRRDESVVTIRERRAMTANVVAAATSAETGQVREMHNTAAIDLTSVEHNGRRAGPLVADPVQFLGVPLLAGPQFLH